MTGDLLALICHRLDRAHQTLREGRALAEIQSWNGALNRLYYACFYAVTALLSAYGFASAKHTGVRALFNQHFIAPHRLDREMGVLFNQLFIYRQQGDYEDYLEVTQDMVAPSIPHVEAFIAEIERVLASLESSQKPID